ncbi:uncharacterized protein [Diabrotica undecimpunctata]|uniref:uncharacterized protein isoform X2 n=1 Tax=Diabrotica undecimpunctata TaxID=50387 RepID=UPI003B63CD66
MASNFSNGLPIKMEDLKDEIIVKRSNIKQEKDKGEYIIHPSYFKIQVKEELTYEESHCSDVDHCVDTNNYLKGLNTKVDIDDIKYEKCELDDLPKFEDEFVKETIKPSVKSVPQLGLPKRHIQGDVDKVIEYLNNKQKNRQDGIDFLFLSYADTFKKLSPRPQIHLKLKLAKLFANAELQLLEQTGNSQSTFHSNIT